MWIFVLWADFRGSPDDEKEAGLAEGDDQFQSGNQQAVAYRVLQVTEGDEQGLIATGLPAGTQVAQELWHRCKRFDSNSMALSTF